MNFIASLFTARTSFYHSNQPVALKGREKASISLVDFCKRLTPPYRVNPFLFSGHLQTAWTLWKEPQIGIYYKRKLFESDNDLYTGGFAVDFVARGDANFDEDPSLPPQTAYYRDDEVLESVDDRPMLIVLHGLCGGSYEPYVKHVLAPLVAGGWEACIVISRGCAMTKVTSGILYNARSTWDVRQMVRFLREKFPNRPLYAIGFSLGANILTNYLGEEGERCCLRAAAVCANPWNLEVVHLALQRSWLGLNIYSKFMGASMKELVQRHAEAILRNHKIAANAIEKIRYLFDFDSAIQLPTWGYPTKGAYYRDASSVDALLAVRTPLFALNAEDDPISHHEALPFDEFCLNPYTVLCTTSSGGHLGWFEVGGGRWFVKPVIKPHLLSTFNSLVESAKEGLTKDFQIVAFFERMEHEIECGGADAKTTYCSAPQAWGSDESLTYNPVRRKLQHAQTM